MRGSSHLILQNIWMNHWEQTSSSKNIIKTINSLFMTDFTYDSKEKHLICKFSGRLDTLNCNSLSEEIQNKFQELRLGKTEKEQFEEKIQFDMKDVTYISSSFIRICLNTSHQSGKGNFSIINCDPFLKKTFKIAGLDELLSVSWIGIISDPVYILCRPYDIPP